jgi:hypothetical protein
LDETPGLFNALYHIALPAAGESMMQHLGQIVCACRLLDSGAARSPNLCTQPIHQEVAVRSFAPLIGMLSQIPDLRRPEAGSISCPSFCYSRFSPWSPAATPIARAKLSSRCTAAA